MMKSLCALLHRPGSDRAAFQHYYEAHHAPLAVRHFPFTRYVRNHVLDADGIGFDTISEFWAEDILATAALMEGEVGAILRADEERFMDRTAIAPAGGEEHMLSAGSPTDAAGERIATLIGRGGGEEAGFRVAVLGWARSVGQAMPGVSVDFVTSWGGRAFPAAAVLWSPAPPAGAPAGLGRISHIRVRRDETPASGLLGNAT